MRFLVGFLPGLHSDAVGFGTDGTGEVVGSVSSHNVRNFLPQQNKSGQNLQSGNRYQRLKRGVGHNARHANFDKQY